MSKKELLLLMFLPVGLVVWYLVMIFSVFFLALAAMEAVVNYVLRLNGSCN